MIVIVLLYIGLIVLMIAAMWKLFDKAGQPGWAAIVPFYNYYVLTTQVAKKEILWFVLMLIPFVNLIAIIVVMMEVARKFGKSEMFGIGMVFLGFIFLPILAFGDAEYEGGRRGYDDGFDDGFDEGVRGRKKKGDDNW